MEKGRNRAGKKTVIAAVLAGLIAIGCATTTLVTGDGLFEYQLQAEALISSGPKVVNISKYLGTDKDLVIPGEIEGSIVRSISHPGFGFRMSDAPGKYVGAFEGKSLTSVIFPDSIRTIEMRVFARNNLTNVTLPNKVSLGQSVFAENPITSFTLGTDIKCHPDSLNTLAPYYYGNKKQAGIYTLDDNTWKFNDVVLNLPIIIRTIFTNETSISMVGLDGNVFSILMENPYEMNNTPDGIEYWIPVGTRTLGILKNDKKLEGVVSLTAGTPNAELQGNFQSGTIYEVREKADKTGVEYKEIGPWTPPK